MSACINESSNPPKRKKKNKNLIPLQKHDYINQHLPNFVGHSTGAILCGIAFDCGVEDGLQVFTFNIRWIDSSTSAAEKWRFIKNAATNQSGVSGTAWFLGKSALKEPKASLNIDYDKTVTVRKFSLMVLYKHLMG
ncbi:unnamed protein product [Cylicocyclus nassatus]|uniref:Uncharacterized protein n=1 Tax=Cylicocyclus nassatus TaxID=53992 RepID=A0AA36M8L3_CYLNA|nr:unnamed protein product [Cylicocyclus nassatus]